MKKSILFVCTGNSCRSVMAEFLFKKMTKDLPLDLIIRSAGVSAIDGYGASMETMKVLEETEGIDASAHESRHLTADMIQTADWIFAMEPMHKDAILAKMPNAKSKVKLLTEYAWDGGKKAAMNGVGVPDPIRMSNEFYKSVLDLIKNCLQKITEDLKAGRI